MRLLTPQERKDAELEEEQKKRKAIDLTNEALTKAIKSLNEFKDRDKDSREQIKREYQKLCGELESKKSALELDVSTLENRRREAMKPLDEVKRGLDLRERELDKVEVELSKRAESLEFKEKEVRELADKNDRRFGELKDFEAELHQRDVGFADEKAILDHYIRHREQAVKKDLEKARSLLEEYDKKLKQQKKQHAI